METNRKRQKKSTKIKQRNPKKSTSTIKRLLVGVCAHLQITQILAYGFREVETLVNTRKLYLYKNELYLQSLVKSYRRSATGQVQIHQDTPDHLPSTITNNRSVYESNNLRQMHIVSHASKFFKNWFDDVNFKAKYISVTRSYHRIFITIDFARTEKNFGPGIRHTSVYESYYNISNFTLPQMIQRVYSVNCSKSVFVANLMSLAHVCHDGYNFYFRSHPKNNTQVLKSFLRPMSGVDPQNPIPAENFEILNFPTSTPNSTQFIVFSYGSGKIYHIVSARFMTLFVKKTEIPMNIYSLRYVGNSILLLRNGSFFSSSKYFYQPLQFQQLFFFGKKWIKIDKSIRFLTSFYSQKRKALVLEFNEQVFISNKEKGTKAEVYIYSYIFGTISKEMKLASIRPVKIFGPNGSESDGTKTSIFYRRIVRRHSHSYVVSFIQYSDSLVSTKVYNQTILTDIKTGFDFQVEFNYTNGASSYPRACISLPGAHGFLVFFDRPFSFVRTWGETTVTINKASMVYLILGTPRLAAKWQIANYSKGVSLNNVSFWVDYPPKPFVISRHMTNFTVNFGDGWINQPSIWIRERNETQVQVIYPNNQDMLWLHHYVRGTLISRIYLEPNGSLSKVLDGQALVEETDFDKILTLMRLAFFRTINFRMSFFEQFGDTEIDNLMGLVTELKAEDFKYFLFLKYKKEDFVSIYKVTGKTTQQVFVKQLFYPGKILKIFNFKPGRMIYTRDQGLYLLHLETLKEEELHHPGQNCMDLVIAQHPALELMLICLKEDQEVSFYLLNLIMAGKSMSAQLVVDPINNVVRLNKTQIEALKVLTSAKQPEAILLFFRNSTESEVNLIIYRIVVQDSIAIRLQREVVIDPYPEKSKTDLTSKRYFKIRDAVFFEHYLVFLIENQSGELSICIKLVAKGYRIFHMKTVELDPIFKLGKYGGLMPITKITQDASGVYNIGFLVSFHVRVGSTENMITMNVKYSKMEALQCTILPYNDQFGIIPFTIFFNHYNQIGQGVGVLRLQQINKPHFAKKKMPNLVHFFENRNPTIQLNRYMRNYMKSVFNQHDDVIVKAMYFENYITRHRLAQKRILLTKNVKYRYVKGYSKFFFEGTRVTTDAGEGDSGVIKGPPILLIPQNFKPQKNQWYQKFNFVVEMTSKLKGSVQDVTMEVESVIDQMTDDIVFHDFAELSSNTSLDFIDDPQSARFDFTCYNYTFNSSTTYLGTWCTDYHLFLFFDNQIIHYFSYLMEYMETNYYGAGPIGDQDYHFPSSSSGGSSSSKSNPYSFDFGSSSSSGSPKKNPYSFDFGSSSSSTSSTSSSGSGSGGSASSGSGSGTGSGAAGSSVPGSSGSGGARTSDKASSGSSGSPGSSRGSDFVQPSGSRGAGSKSRILAQKQPQTGSNLKAAPSSSTANTTANFYKLSSASTRSSTTGSSAGSRLQRGAFRFVNFNFVNLNISKQQQFFASELSQCKRPRMMRKFLLTVCRNSTINQFQIVWYNTYHFTRGVKVLTGINPNKKLKDIVINFAEYSYVTILVLTHNTNLVRKAIFMEFVETQEHYYEASNVNPRPIMTCNLYFTWSLNSMSTTINVRRKVNSDNIFTSKDGVSVFSVSCQLGDVCWFSRDIYIVKFVESMMVDSFKRTQKFKFRITDGSDQTIYLMKNPKISLIHTLNPEYVTLMISFNPHHSFIFKYAANETQYSLNKTQVFKIQNQFFGLPAVEAYPPLCFKWCCVIAKYYQWNQTMLSFYNISKVKFGNVTYYGDTPTGKKTSNINELPDEDSITSFSVEFFDGRMIDYKFQPLPDMDNYESLSLIVLTETKTMLNYTLNFGMRVEFSNLYVSSRNLTLNFLGFFNQSIKVSFDITFHESASSLLYIFRIGILVLFSLCLIAVFGFCINAYMVSDREHSAKKKQIFTKIDSIIKLVDDPELKIPELICERIKQSVINQYNNGAFKEYQDDDELALAKIFDYFNDCVEHEIDMRLESPEIIEKLGIRVDFGEEVDEEEEGLGRGLGKDEGVSGIELSVVA